MTRSLVSALALALVSSSAGCSKDEDKKGGLPPAKDWEEPADPGPAPTVEAPSSAASGDPSNPHAGMSGDPHAGMRSNPHAGMGGGAPAGMGEDPHAGLGMKSGPGAGHGMPGSDPSRPIDESKFLAGTIVAGDDVGKRIKPGSVVFITAHRFDPKSDGPTGSSIAVQKLESSELPASFRLTERSAMGSGGFSGEVVITAWTDQDRDAISKQPGDVLGRVKATIPAEGLELKLDTILE